MVCCIEIIPKYLELQIDSWKPNSGTMFAKFGKA